MKNYVKFFKVPFIIFAIFLIIGISCKMITSKREAAGYVRANTECLTKERVFDYADKLTEEEEAQIVDAITDVTELNIVYLLDKRTEPVTEAEPEECVQDIQAEEEICKEERVIFYKRNILSGEMLKADKDMVVFGNVSPGAVLASTNSIYVFGGLYGEAYAGVDSGNDYVIAAMDFVPEKVGIGRLEYEGKKVLKWKKKNGFEPQIAYVRKNKIVTEQITKELLNSLV